MLVVGCHDTRRDHLSVRHLLVYFDRCRGENACCTNFVPNTRRLREVECDDIFVFRHSDDSLQDEDPRFGDDSILCPTIGMLPENTVVDFVAAYQYRKLRRRNQEDT